MLVGKVGLRRLTDATLAPLLHALEAERAARLDRGRKKTRGEGIPQGLPPEANGDGA
jgi:hypothetical protein